MNVEAGVQKLCEDPPHSGSARLEHRVSREFLLMLPLFQMCWTVSLPCHRCFLGRSVGPQTAL